MTLTKVVARFLLERKRFPMAWTWALEQLLPGHPMREGCVLFGMG